MTPLEVVLAVFAVILLINLVLEKRANKRLQERLEQYLTRGNYPRLGNIGLGKQFGSYPKVDRPRTTRRDTRDIEASGRQGRIATRRGSS